MSYAIKDEKTGLYVKHTGRMSSYPFDEDIKDIKDAEQYKTLEHANYVAFWHLDHSTKWVIVNTETGEEYEKKTPMRVSF